MRHEWEGDSDLGDGKSEPLYQEYTNRRGFFSGIGIKERRQQLEADLNLVISGLKIYLKMLHCTECLCLWRHVLAVFSAAKLFACLELVGCDWSTGSALGILESLRDFSCCQSNG